MVAGLGNKVRPNTLLKHIATLRERKLAIHHARLTSMLCCPAATVSPGVCAHTHAALCFPRALIHRRVYPGCGSRLQRNGRAKWFCPCTLRRSETCLKVGEYGRPAIFRNFFVCSLTLYFFYSDVLKVGVGSKNSWRISSQIAPVVPILSGFSWLEDQPPHIPEAEDAHLSRWRETDIFFFLSIFGLHYIKITFVSSQTLWVWQPYGFNVHLLETEAARANCDCFHRGNSKV